MLDTERVAAEIETAERWIDRVEAFCPDSLEAYREEAMARAATERALHLAIDALADAASLFVSGLRLGMPDPEYTTIERLEGRVLTREEASRLEELQSLAADLLHHSEELDDERVYQRAEGFPEQARQLTGAFREALEQQAAR